MNDAMEMDYLMGDCLNYLDEDEDDDFDYDIDDDDDGEDDDDISLYSGMGGFYDSSDDEFLENLLYHF